MDRAKIPELLTASELASRLRLRPSTIRKWSREGRLPVIHAGRRRLLFDPVAVLEALRKPLQPAERIE